LAFAVVKPMFSKFLRFHIFETGRTALPLVSLVRFIQKILGVAAGILSLIIHLYSPQGQSTVFTHPNEKRKLLYNKPVTYVTI
jgi:hypothetical protein